MTEPYRMPQPGEGWRHYKGRSTSLYEVVDVGVHTETGEPVVIYKAYQSWEQRPRLYVRPLNVWLASVEYEGRHVPRFEFERPSKEG